MLKTGLFSEAKWEGTQSNNLIESKIGRKKLRGRGLKIELW
jgi:hypothetical protein